MTDPRSEAIDRMTDWIEPVEILREPTMGHAPGGDEPPPEKPTKPADEEG